MDVFIRRLLIAQLVVVLLLLLPASVDMFLVVLSVVNLGVGYYLMRQGWRLGGSGQQQQQQMQQMQGFIVQGT